DLDSLAPPDRRPTGPAAPGTGGRAHEVLSAGMGGSAAAQWARTSRIRDVLALSGEREAPSALRDGLERLAGVADPGHQSELDRLLGLDPAVAFHQLGKLLDRATGALGIELMHLVLERNDVLGVNVEIRGLAAQHAADQRLVDQELGVGQAQTVLLL